MVKRSGGRTRVVQRIAEAIRSQRLFPLERARLASARAGSTMERQRRGVWCDDEVLSNPSLEREVGNSERAVLIGEMTITQLYALSLAPHGTP